MVLPRFLAELKRRKVYRVALVYAGVGWALLEAADVVLPRLALPDWTVNLVLALVLLGFPLALVFAWIFDISPEGIVRTEPLAPEDHPHRFSIAAIVEFVLIVALVAVVGGLYVKQLSLQKELAEAKSAVPGSPVTGQPEASLHRLSGGHPEKTDHAKDQPETARRLRALRWSCPWRPGAYRNGGLYISPPSVQSLLRPRSIFIWLLAPR